MRPMRLCSPRTSLVRSARRSSQRCLSTASPSASATTDDGKRKVIFSGIQPTGIPHLGNYLGALRQWVNLQQSEPASTRLLYSLVDLHAITVKQDAKQLRQWRRESLATLLAIGLDSGRSTIFFQSEVPQHTELMWVLSCTTGVGRLGHMTQWKSKLNLPENAKPLDTPLQLGLFTYPVLQAADILVHSVTHVPVGQDQTQHLEFARGCASAFNVAYGAKVLVEPKTVLSSARKVMSLQNPSKKMSKSDANAKSRILITDSRDEVAAKVKAAVTDSLDGVSYDAVTRPEIANLVNIMVHLGHQDTTTSDASIEERAKALVEGIQSKSALKDLLTDVIDAHIAPIRARYLDIMDNEAEYLVDVAEEGAEMARASAEVTMRKVRNVVGFGPI